MLKKINKHLIAPAYKHKSTHWELSERSRTDCKEFQCQVLMCSAVHLETQPPGAGQVRGALQGLLFQFYSGQWWRK